MIFNWFIFALVVLIFTGHVSSCPDTYSETLQQVFDMSSGLDLTISNPELCEHSMLMECIDEKVTTHFSKINVSNITVTNILPLKTTPYKNKLFRKGRRIAISMNSYANKISSIEITPPTSILEVEVDPVFTNETFNKNIMVNGTIDFAIAGQDREFTMSYGASIEKMGFIVHFECVVFQQPGIFEVDVKSRYLVTQYPWKTQVDQCFKLGLGDDVCQRLLKIVDTHATNAFRPAINKAIEKLVGAQNKLFV